MHIPNQAQPGKAQAIGGRRCNGCMQSTMQYLQTCNEMDMDAMDMARKPNQILPRKGMYTYEPCVTQKRCRNPQPTYQRGNGALHMQNTVLTRNIRVHTRPGSTWKGASHRRKAMQWMHATLQCNIYKYAMEWILIHWIWHASQTKSCLGKACTHTSHV